MTKRAYSKAEPSFISHYHRLSQECRLELAALLGKASNEEERRAQELALLDAEMFLGMYPKAVENIDGAPTPADYIAKMKPIHESAQSLLADLNMSAFYRDALTIEEADYYEIQRQLATLATASYRVMKKYQTAPQRKGRTQKKALEIVVLELRRAFQGAFCGSRTERARTGHVRFVTNEVTFVKSALMDAGIIVHGYTGLPALFKKTACDPTRNPPLQRERVVESSQKVAKQLKKNSQRKG